MIRNWAGGGSTVEAGFSPLLAPNQRRQAMLKGSVIGAVMVTVSSLLGLVVVKRFQTFSIDQC
jgi:hypothetical protein